MAVSFDVGDLVRVSGAFVVGSVDTDPGAVSFKLITPGTTPATTTFVYLTDAALVKDSVGHYHIDVSVAVAGEYAYRWIGTGAAQGTEEGIFTVKATRF